MAGLMARAGEVGDLVHLVAVGRQFAPHQRVHRGLLFLVQRVHPPGRERGSESGSRLEGQVVSGKMVGLKLRRRRDIRGHLLQLLAWKRKYQIEAYLLDSAAARVISRLPRLVGIVNPPQNGEQVPMEGLRAQTQTIDARGGKSRSRARSTVPGLA